MRFLVGHIIKGEAGEYHERITREISEQFGTEPIHLKLPPHITLVPPFDWGDAEAPKEALKDAVAFTKPGTFYISSFGHIHTSTIYLSIVPSKETSESVEEIRKQFRIFQGSETFAVPFLPHASVARFLNCNQFSAIWKFLEREDPDYKNVFDSVSLLAQVEGGWKVIAEEIIS